MTSSSSSSSSASRNAAATPADHIPAACGWSGRVADFLQLDPAHWLAAIAGQHLRLYRQRPTATHRQAWEDCCDVVRATFIELAGPRPDSHDWTLAFEYELPREGGRRPDLVILAGDHVVVVEFKQKATATAADVDQVAGYARDLRLYHAGSHHHPVLPALVLTRGNRPAKAADEVAILPPEGLADWLLNLPSDSNEPLDPDRWLAADYAPLPSIVRAAQRVFAEEPLPEIRAARSAGIPQLLDHLAEIVAQAQQQNQRHLVLITGVPGSGKTLVGLQFVYGHASPEPKQRQAVYLTGNGPLLAVLQYALKSRVLVQPVRNFYLTHEARRQKAPRENIIVFDEAQRAWDQERMGEKYGIASSAPEAVLRIGSRLPNWSVLVALLGEGQEIHIGEEAGLGQWPAALHAIEPAWQVHLPPRLASLFAAFPRDRLRTNDLCDLTTSLRTHLAADWQQWVALLLAGQLTAAAELWPRIAAAGYTGYVTRNLAAAQAYCRQRYAEHPERTYGLLASSRARLLPQFGVRNDYKSTQRVKVGPWYSDPPESPDTCRAFCDVVTEFGCQGLELDLPVVCWGEDFRWHDDRWALHTRQRNVRDPWRLRQNSYRVLLTRGRDGLIVFVPPVEQLNPTAAALEKAGLPQLPA